MAAIHHSRTESIMEPEHCFRVDDIQESLQRFIRRTLNNSTNLTTNAFIRVNVSLHQTIALGTETCIVEQAVLKDIHLPNLSQRPFEKTSAESEDEINLARRHELPGNTPNPRCATSYRSTRRPLHRYTGGLRLKEQLATKAPEARRLNVDGKTFPKRRKRQYGVQKMEPSSVQKLLRSIWDQIHGDLSFDLRHVIDQWNQTHRVTAARLTTDEGGPSNPKQTDNIVSDDSFQSISQFCQKITQASRSCRALEVIVQARWVQSFDQRVDALRTQHAQFSLTDCRMRALNEACKDFGWSEKELRNKLSIWRGYKDIQEAGGWAALIFAGMGLYRFCKYRVSFTDQSMKKLLVMQQRIEVAADTIHPYWRKMLSIIGIHSEPVYRGHPHDWVISQDHKPIPLATTYLQWTPDFSFEHLETSVIDQTAWGQGDPRNVLMATINNDGYFVCERCNRVQSECTDNKCCCFTGLFGNTRKRHCPVQIFRTNDGRNNGLMACCPFDRGVGIGEFLGLITSGVSELDVLQATVDTATYQIYQGLQGNYTRFINHSCTPNSQLERFTWLGVQRIVLVSKGIDDGCEITVDYSEDYWTNLNKKCLCGTPKCRYTNKAAQ